MNRILLVTTTTDLAADLIILNLRRRGVSFARVNQDDFPQRIAITWPGKGAGAQIAAEGELIRCDDIRSAWFRGYAQPRFEPGENQRTMEFVSQECAAFLAGVWQTSRWFWINPPSAVALASNKLRQLALADSHGFRVPRTLVTNCAKAARDFVGAGHCIAKAVIATGFTEADRKYAIYTTPIAPDDLSQENVQSAPVIYQERIANQYDLRVTVVGERVFASRIRVSERGMAEADWRSVDLSRVGYEPHALPLALERACVAFVKANALVFAALDFIITPEGDHVFLEINPSGQWGWLEDATSDPITDTIVDHLVGDAA